MRFSLLLSAVIGALFLSQTAQALSVARPNLVCKDTGTQPGADEEDCSAHGGIVVMTGYQSSSYDDCVAKADATDALPPHHTPWTAPARADTDPEEREAIASKNRRSYCRGLYPIVNNANGTTQAWVGDGYYTQVAVSLDNYDTCVKRLTAADEIPLNHGHWKEDGIEPFCKTKAREARPGKASASGNGKYRSRWVQEGGSWVSPWVDGHDEAVCHHGMNCNCGGVNACGDIKAGATTSVWPNGCTGQKWTIRCESEGEEGQEGGKSDSAGLGLLLWKEVGDGMAEQGTCSQFNQAREGQQCKKAGERCHQMRGNAISGGLSFVLLECKPF
jgi:hypothetical protein